MADLNGMTDPDPPANGVAFRQQANLGQRAYVNAHPCLRWLITTHKTIPELEAHYLATGSTQEQWNAFMRRVRVVEAGGPIDAAHQRKRDAARIAATLDALVPNVPGDVPFPRQVVPRGGLGGRPRSRSPRSRRQSI